MNFLFRSLILFPLKHCYLWPRTSLGIPMTWISKRDSIYCPVHNEEGATTKFKTCLRNRVHLLFEIIHQLKIDSYREKCTPRKCRTVDSRESREFWFRISSLHIVTPTLITHRHTPYCTSDLDICLAQVERNSIAKVIEEEEVKEK